MSELLKCDADGQELSPVYNREAGRISSSGSWEPDVLTDERVIEQDEEDRVFAMVEGDHHAKKVLHGLLDGLKKKDIMSQLDLSEKQYAAVVKRILRLLGPLNGGSKGIATCPHVNLDRPCLLWQRDGSRTMAHSSEQSQFHLARRVAENLHPCRSPHSGMAAPQSPSGLQHQSLRWRDAETARGRRPSRL